MIYQVGDPHIFIYFPQPIPLPQTLMKERVRVFLRWIQSHHRCRLVTQWTIDPNILSLLHGCCLGYLRREGAVPAIGRRGWRTTWGCIPTYRCYSHSSSRLTILRVNLLVASVATVFSRKKCTIGRSNGIVIPTSKMLWSPGSQVGRDNPRITKVCKETSERIG